MAPLPTSLETVNSAIIKINPLYLLEITNIIIDLLPDISEAGKIMLVALCGGVQEKI